MLNKISIITPSFNQCEYLEDAIKSVINQKNILIELLDLRKKYIKDDVISASKLIAKLLKKTVASFLHSSSQGISIYGVTGVPRSTSGKTQYAKLLVEEAELLA